MDNLTLRIVANLQDMLSMEKDYANYHMDGESWARYRLVKDMMDSM